MSLVDALWMVDLLAGRAAAAMVDFILGGPTASYLAGRAPRPGDPFILVTSREYSGELARAASVAAEPTALPRLRGVTGLVWAGRLYGWRLAVLEDPTFTIQGRTLAFRAPELARRAPIAVVNGRTVRLAPPDLEQALEAAGLTGPAWP